MSNLLSNLLASVTQDSATNGLSTLLGGSTALTLLNTAAQTAVKAAVTQIDGGVDYLRTAFDKFEASNPVVSTAVSTGLSLVKSQGLILPSEDNFVEHVKAAIADVAAGLGVATASTAPAATVAPATDSSASTDAASTATASTVAAASDTASTDAASTATASDATAAPASTDATAASTDATASDASASTATAADPAAPSASSGS